MLIDDALDVFQIALRKLGYSGNTRDAKQIEAAYHELQKLMPNVLAFNSDNPGNPFIEGEVNLGMVWNGSAFVARQAGTPLEVVWPKEGAMIYIGSKPRTYFTRLFFRHLGPLGSARHPQGLPVRCGCCVRS